MMTVLLIHLDDRESSHGRASEIADLTVAVVDRLSRSAMILRQASPPASTMTRPLSRLWLITVETTDSAMSSRRATADVALHEVAEHVDTRARFGHALQVFRMRQRRRRTDADLGADDTDRRQPCRRRRRRRRARAPRVRAARPRRRSRTNRPHA